MPGLEKILSGAKSGVIQYVNSVVFGTSFNKTQEEERSHNRKMEKERLYHILKIVNELILPNGSLCQINSGTGV